MKILLHSNAPWASTGYGVQTRQIITQVPQVSEHEFAVSAFYGLQGAILKAGGVSVYPGGRDRYGNDVVAAHAQHYGADVILTLIDAWVIDGGRWPVPWAAYVPIDHAPVPAHVAKALEASRWQIAMSLFGRQQLIAAGFPALYVPHAVDCDVYTPGDRARARRRVGLPDQTFIVGMVAANQDSPSRKCLPQALQAFAEFLSSNPNTLLYLHTNPTPSSNGVDLLRLIDDLGVAEKVVICDQHQYLIGFPEGYMADVYRAMDVLLMPSRGEGFGVPLIEAQACGTPVIATDATAMAELVGSGWLLTESERWWSAQGAWQAMPRVDEIVDKLAEAYYDLTDRETAGEMSEAARTFALEYHAPHVARAYWTPVLDKIAGDLASERARREPVVIPARGI